jgi:hypothetical protein
MLTVSSGKYKSLSPTSNTKVQMIKKSIPMRALQWKFLKKSVHKPIEFKTEVHIKDDESYSNLVEETIIKDIEEGKTIENSLSQHIQTINCDDSSQSLLANPLVTIEKKITGFGNSKHNKISLDSSLPAIRDAHPYENPKSNIFQSSCVNSILSSIEKKDNAINNRYSKLQVKNKFNKDSNVEIANLVQEKITNLYKNFEVAPDLQRNYGKEIKSKLFYIRMKINMNLEDRIDGQSNSDLLNMDNIFDRSTLENSGELSEVLFSPPVDKFCALEKARNPRTNTSFLLHMSSDHGKVRSPKSSFIVPLKPKPQGEEKPSNNIILRNKKMRILKRNRFTTQLPSPSETPPLCHRAPEEERQKKIHHRRIHTEENSPSPALTNPIPDSTSNTPHHHYPQELNLLSSNHLNVNNYDPKISFIQHNPKHVPSPPRPNYSVRKSNRAAACVSVNANKNSVITRLDRRNSRNENKATNKSSIHPSKVSSIISPRSVSNVNFSPSVRSKNSQSHLSKNVNEETKERYVNFLMGGQGSDNCAKLPIVKPDIDEFENERDQIFTFKDKSLTKLGIGKYGKWYIHPQKWNAGFEHKKPYAENRVNHFSVINKLIRQVKKNKNYKNVDCNSCPLDEQIIRKVKWLENFK